MKTTKNNIIEDLINDIPLEIKIKTMVNIELINFVHDLGLRESGYWTDSEQDEKLLNKIDNAVISLTENLMEEINEHQQQK